MFLSVTPSTPTVSVDTDSSVSNNRRVLKDVGERVRALRKAKGWTQAELGDRADGLNKETINRLELGGNSTLDTVFRVAEALDVSPEALLGAEAVRLEVADDLGDVEPDHLDVSGYVKDDIPVIAEGEASPQGGLFWDDEGKLKSEVEDRISRPYDVTDPMAYGVRVRGDSMLPAYKPGMTLVVSPNIKAQDGDEVYVQLLSGERLVKVARKMAGGWLLESMNPAYAPRFVQLSEIGAMHPVLWARRARNGQTKANL